MIAARWLPVSGSGTTMSPWAPSCFATSNAETISRGPVLPGRSLHTPSLSPWLSDALCRLASGGSFAVRQLYTDDEEMLLKAARPTLLNGIEDIIGRSDLADRAIFLTLGPIGEEQRRSETELWREFELARPGILDRKEGDQWPKGESRRRALPDRRPLPPLGHCRRGRKRSDPSPRSPRSGARPDAQRPRPTPLRPRCSRP
jgi:hypothetical protein